MMERAHEEEGYHGKGDVLDVSNTGRPDFSAC